MSPQARTGLIAFGIVGGAFLVVGLVVGVLVGGRPGGVFPGGSSGGSGGGLFGPSRPRADKEGETWTHKELMECLNGRGFDLVMARSGSNRPDVTVTDFLSPQGAIVVEVWRFSTAAAAKDKAGISPGDYSWGRFYFNTLRQPDTAQRLRKALEG